MTNSEKHDMEIYGHGKLLICGEYFILDGALGLAVPTKFGQKISIKYKEQNDGILFWSSFDYLNNQWFEAKFNINNFSILETSDQTIAGNLKKILLAAKTQNSQFLSDRKNDLAVKSRLEFPSNWGLGSSSTLIYSIAKWASINPYLLLENSFGGSGYDIACAGNDHPLLFQLKYGLPKWQMASFDPPFKENIFFVHLGKKKNSREAIAEYKKKRKDVKPYVKEISALTKEINSAEDLTVFCNLLDKHEKIVGSFLNISPLKMQFPEFIGSCKSLGAWGGDFIMAVNQSRDPGYVKSYFQQKGFDVVLGWNEMIL